MPSYSNEKSIVSKDTVLCYKNLKLVQKKPCFLNPYFKQTIS